MKKQILLPSQVFTQLHREFGVHRVVLNRALKFEHNSKRDRLLRVEALKRGGLIYTGVNAPDVDTYFDHAQGVMRQFFGNRVELCVSRETNNAKIIIDGNTVATFDDMTLGNWSNVLYSLQQIYNQLNA